ncbi:MAG: tRNA (adenosine(37)-N6)-threonylcarbamoyltransferase complex dimerization subunit type 1 TsaB [Chloroflexi bacterium]|nr:tRNA (adenosine(37)-N6)-threonylcarbamoyltransferase complex dimerization subunit type 1 TsaB [Chloroflexota bacterium]
MELAIDTATEMASIALCHEDEVRAELTWAAGQSHTAQLVPNILHLLNLAQTTIEQLEGIIVANGPGSFTGLRVGMSTAKGLALALDIPVVGISTLEAEAYPYAITGRPICSLLDAGRGEVAAALYQQQGEQWRRLREEHIISVEALAVELPQRSLCCGQLSATIKERLAAVGYVVAPSQRRAGCLARLGWRRLKVGDKDDLATFQPLYLRRPAVTG